MDADRAVRASLSLYEVPPTEGELTDANSYYDTPPGPSTSSQYYDVPPVLEESSDHYNKLAQELLSTEERYLGDLLLAKKLFHGNLIKLPYRSEVDTIFRYWDKLTEVSRKVYMRLKKSDSPGQVLISEIDSLSVFVEFCSHQQTALDALNKLLTHPDAQKLYA
ncbi:hypothetical protein OESDEN_16825, partial [Oesophagostomum dentatum]